MRIAILFPSLLLTTFLFAQPQLENASYESWTDVGSATEEPVEWSSVKTSDGGGLINTFAPQLCWRSTDAHTGTYSLNLRTVTSAVGAATGLLTNGRVHAEFTIANSYVFSDLVTAEWNTVCGSRPDSLIGWYKASPASGDRAKVTALMHVEQGKLPMFDTYPNWVGTAAWGANGDTVSTWSRFSVPFNYLDERSPEHVLLAVSCGDSTLSTIGTQAWFDDLGLIYNVYATSDESIAFVNASTSFDLNVGYNTSGEPNAATDFSVEISDENGDFSNATVIGTVNSTSASGTIPCTIPAGTIPGIGYLLRVVTPSEYYAPVPTGIIVEISTGIASITTAYAIVRVIDHTILVDLRTSELERPRYELIDARGARVGQGQLQGNAMNRIPVDVAQGVMVLRVFHKSGAFVQRVFVP